MVHALMTCSASPKPKKVVKQRSAARDRQIKAAIEEMRTSSNKPLLNMVVCGHVDAGKSTMMGHLLYLIGDVTQRQLHKCVVAGRRGTAPCSPHQQWHRFEQEAKREGKASFAYAWVMDAHSGTCSGLRIARARLTPRRGARARRHDGRGGATLRNGTPKHLPAGCSRPPRLRAQYGAPLLLDGDAESPR